jgi:hypothetical protein
MLGVASSLVAVAALTIVFAGSGEAQGNATGPNVTVVNTPLPVTGNVTATMSGNVSANIINPANNPVLIRNVDAQGVKELWQKSNGITLSTGESGETVTFDPVPAGKALVIEHVNVYYQDYSSAASIPTEIRILTAAFGGVNADSQYLLMQPSGLGFVADKTTKFYVGPEDSLVLSAQRDTFNGIAAVFITATGYLVDYP